MVKPCNMIQLGYSYIWAYYTDLLLNKHDKTIWKVLFIESILEDIDWYNMIFEQSDNSVNLILLCVFLIMLSNLFFIFW